MTTHIMQLHPLVEYEAIRDALESKFNFRFSNDDGRDSYIKSRLLPENIAPVKNAKGNAFRQGDVLLKMLEGSLEEQGVDLEEWTLAEDHILVQTTHTHELVRLNDNSQIRVYKNAEQESMYLVVEGDGVAVIHQEHKTLIIPGNMSYLVQKQRTLDPLTQIARSVAD